MPSNDTNNIAFRTALVDWTFSEAQSEGEQVLKWQIRTCLLNYLRLEDSEATKIALRSYERWPEASAAMIKICAIERLALDAETFEAVGKLLPVDLVVHLAMQAAVRVVAHEAHPLRVYRS